MTKKKYVDTGTIADQFRPGGIYHGFKPEIPKGNNTMTTKYPKYSKHCPSCDSENIVCDAWVEWDIDTQSWGLKDFFEACFCISCEASFDRTEIVEQEVHNV